MGMVRKEYRKNRKVGLRMKILQWMKEHHVFFDGGMGSLLQAQGLQAGELPET